MNSPIRPEVLQVRNLSVEYPNGHLALDGLDLTVASGHTVGLIGPSGCGKTTAARAMLNLFPPGPRISGSVTLDGLELQQLPEQQMRKIRWERLALIPQAAMNALDPVMPVDLQIAEVIRTHRRIERRAALEMAQVALESVGIPRNRASSYPHQFSGGMRQRASIAMATALEPDVLIADEPTTGLDVVVQDKILELLVQARTQFGLALVVVTHDLGVANELCDEMVVLEQGRTISSGPSADVLRRRTPPAAPEDDDAARRASLSAAPHVLDAVDVTVRYRSGRGLAALRRANELTALDRVSLGVRRGEVVGLAGESGCGKSSLVSTLIGLNDVASGTITIGGTEASSTDSPEWAALRSRVQMIFQDPYDSLNPRMTVYQTVVEPLASQCLAEGEDTVARVVDALEDAGLSPGEEYLDRLPHQLSGGERQRVAIARALVVRPELILADEPVSMLDETTADGVMAVLTDLARRRGVAILLVSHDVSLLRRVCDRVAIMYLGQIVEIGATADVLDRPRHPYTQALVRAVPSRLPGVHRDRVRLPGDAPSLRNRPTGCPFHPRCARASETCLGETPTLLPTLEEDISIAEFGTTTPAGHDVACFHPSSEPDLADRREDLSLS